MPLRPVVLKIHLYLALVAGLFLVILGLTGSVIAFEGDLDHWFHPALWYVAKGSHAMAEQDLIDIANRGFAPAHAVAVQHFRDPQLVKAIRMSDAATVLLSPWNGHVTGRFTAPSATVRYLGYIHQLHMRLVPDPRSMKTAAEVGQDIVLAAGFLACLTVPTGVFLWWRTKRASIRFGASLFRVVFDMHNTIGIWSCVFLFMAAFTGFMVEQERVYFALAGSGRPGPIPKIVSSPQPGVNPVTADRALAAASAALAGASVQSLQLPLGPAGIFIVTMRFPEDSSETAHSPVLVDQYTGEVRFVRNFLTDSPGFRWVRFNRAIHTGDALGFLGHAILSLSSLALAVMTITGLIIWRKKARLR